MDIHSPIHTDIHTHDDSTHPHAACLPFLLLYFLSAPFYLCAVTFDFLLSPHTVSPHTDCCSFSFFLSSSYTFFYPLLRKLPWLSRQSDRLLTDRSLVRSQAEAPFLLFTIIILSKYIPYIDTNKKYASRGSRTHDRAVKSRALYRLS